MELGRASATFGTCGQEPKTARGHPGRTGHGSSHQVPAMVLDECESALGGMGLPYLYRASHPALGGPLPGLGARCCRLGVPGHLDCRVERVVVPKGRMGRDAGSSTGLGGRRVHGLAAASAAATVMWEHRMGRPGSSGGGSS